MKWNPESLLAKAAEAVRSVRFLRFAQVLVFALTSILLVAHTFRWSWFRVDAISMALLAGLILIPLVELIRKIKLGNFEAEIGREEVARVRAEAELELSTVDIEGAAHPEEVIKQLLTEDPRLALAHVRMELELSLRRLYAIANGVDPVEVRFPLGRLVREIERSEILNAGIGRSLRDVISLANRAVHGEAVDCAAAEELAQLGYRLIREVQQAFLERMLRPAESLVIEGKDVDSFVNANYRVTTVVPLVSNPKKNIYIFDQDALDAFLETYEEYAEFVVSIEKL